MASRRRRRKSIGKVIVDAERRLRRMEKRPGARRLKNNVVTTDKIGYRAVRTKYIDTDAVTANEAAFGTTIVSETEPTDFVKDGTTWVDPTDGTTQVYSDDLSAFVTVSDPDAAAALTAVEGKNSVYRQDDPPTGGTYTLNDIWIDTNDGNKLYVWTGTAWELRQDAGINAAQTTANGKNKVIYSTDPATGSGTTAGDIWFQYNASNQIIAQYEWSGSAWVSKTIGNAVIANLDAGKITSGFLSVSGTVKVGTATSGSRIELTPTGFYAYNGTTPTVQILAANGSAEFLGTIKSGSTITGASFSSTNTSTGGIEISERTTGSDQIVFRGSSAVQGYIQSFTSGEGGGLNISGPNGPNTQVIRFLSSGSITIEPGGAGGVINLNNRSATTVASVLSGGVVISSPPSVSSYFVRNIRGYLSGGGFVASTNTDGIIGDIAVVYT